LLFHVNSSTSTRRRKAQLPHWLAAFTTAALLATLLAGTATAATGGTDDPAVISEWNEIAVTTLAGDTTKQPVEAFLYMGFVQAAVYDAVVGVEGRYEPYRFHAHAPRGASAQAAAVAAAHKVLVTYSPYAQATLDERYAAALAQIPDGKAKTRGIAFGTRAAEHLSQTARPRRPQRSHRNQPATGARCLATHPARTPADVGPVARLRHAVAGAKRHQFAPPPPPALTSAGYTRDFNEVKALGSATSTERTPAQTDTARFFSGSALVQYNAALRDQVRVRDLDIVDAARMFAAVRLCW
jgi:hypothetical protein